VTSIEFASDTFWSNFFFHSFTVCLVLVYNFILLIFYFLKKEKVVRKMKKKEKIID